VSSKDVERLEMGVQRACVLQNFAGVLQVCCRCVAGVLQCVALSGDSSRFCNTL